MMSYVIFQKNPESGPTLPTGEHISIVVLSPLKIFNPDVDRVYFGAIQVKPALEVWLLLINPFEISLKKTALADMVFVVVGVAVAKNNSAIKIPKLTLGGLSKCAAFTSVSSSPLLLKIFHFPSVLGTPLETA